MLPRVVVIVATAVLLPLLLHFLLILIPISHHIINLVTLQLCYFVDLGMKIFFSEL